VQCYRIKSNTELTLDSRPFRSKLRDRANIFLELEDSDAFGMDFFENGVNGWVGLLIVDREIDLDPRRDDRSGLSIC
jgi:hypothetical protein